MKTVELEIGSPEWQAAFTASKAPTMLGVDKHTSRSELVRQMATGIRKEIDALTQDRFDRGHKIEAIARTFAEEEMDLDIDSRLEPITYAGEFDGITLFASLDGQFLPNNWECKSLNDELRESLARGVIPDRYHPQMEQGLMVSGAESCLFTASDGTREGTMHAWYKPNLALRNRIIAGWKMLKEDVANYVHVEAEPKVVIGPVETLPAIFVTVEGRITNSNLPAFVHAAHEYIDRIQTDLVTDADFETAAKNVNELDSGEKRLEAVKANALAQTSSIDELFRAIDQIKGEMKKKRLHLADLVKTKKENRKTDIVTQARGALEGHIQALNLRLGGQLMPYIVDTRFADAVRGLKSIDSMREKAGNALRNAMLDANMIADRIEANRKALTDAQGNNWNFLFHDFGQVCTKQEDDFAALVAMRSGQHRAENEKRQEAERAKIRAEELANAQAKLNEEAEKIRAEERAKAQAEQEARNAEIRQQQAIEQQKQAEERAHQQAENEKTLADALAAQNKEIRKQLDSANMADALQHGFGTAKAIDANEPPMKLGEISSRLGFAVTADFLAQLGIHQIATERSAKLYAASSFPAICNALIVHIQSASRDWRMAA